MPAYATRSSFWVQLVALENSMLEQTQAELLEDLGLTDAQLDAL